MFSFIFTALVAIAQLSHVEAATQSTSFTQVTSGVSSIVTTGGTANTYYYALPYDCPSTCTICLAGCLFTASSGYTGSGVPSSSLPYSNSAAGTQGSWLALDTTAQGTVPCTVGGGVGATTGALVTISGMTGTYSSTTGTRVSSATSSCGVWTLDVEGPPMKAPVLKPSVQPSSHPITPVAPTRPTVHPPVTTYTFLSIGDWGGAAIDAGIYHNVYAVAAQLKTSAVATNAKFVIGLGDNFYWCGIQNTSDFQIAEDWEKPYAGLNLQWYNILGNHEYGYSVQAQIDYAAINTNWILDDRYYKRRFLVDSATSTYMTLLVVDTNPCISAYRSSAQSGWDPCSTKYPTCSLGSTHDDFEGPCYFHQNILSQDCTAQYDWTSAALDAVPADDWLVIAGHHPADEINVLDFTALFQKRGFALYLNGHTHTLTLYTIDGANAYVTSGAGSLVNTVDQSFATTAAKLVGDDVAVQKIKETELKLSGETAEAVAATHAYKTIWNSATAGFTQHTFNSDFTLLTTDFISYTGAVLYSFTVNKNGVIQ